MAKRQKQRVVLSDYKAKAADRSVEVEDETGKVHLIPPPDLWPDQVFTLLRSEDLIGAAQAIMGADEFAAFVDGGGSAMIAVSIARQEAGMPLGE